MNRGRASVAATRTPANSNGPRPRKSLKSTASPATAPSERPAKLASLANKVVALTGNNNTSNIKVSTPALSDARRRASSTTADPPAMASSSRAATQEGKKPHSSVLSTATMMNTDNNENSSNTKKDENGAAESTAAVFAAAAPHLTKQRPSQSKMSSPRLNTVPNAGGLTTATSTKASDRRANIRFASQNRTPKSIAHDNMQTAGVKLPPLLREDPTSGLDCKSLATMGSTPERANPARTLSPLRETVYPHSTAASPSLQHCGDSPNNDTANHNTGQRKSFSGFDHLYPAHLGPVEDGAPSAPVSPFNNHIPTSLSCSPPQEVRQRTASKLFSPPSLMISHSIALAHGGQPASSAVSPTTSGGGASRNSPSFLSPQPQNSTATVCAPRRGSEKPRKSVERKEALASTNTTTTNTAIVAAGAPTALTVQHKRVANHFTNGVKDGDSANVSKKNTYIKGSTEEKMYGKKTSTGMMSNDEDDAAPAVDEENDDDEVAEDSAEEEDEDDDTSEATEASDEEESDDDDTYDEEDSDVDSDEESESDSDSGSDDDEGDSEDEDSNSHKRSVNGGIRSTQSMPRVAVGGGVTAVEAIRAGNNTGTLGKTGADGGRKQPSLLKRSKAGTSPPASSTNGDAAHTHHHRHSKRKKRVHADEPRRICTKISREGDVNVKVVYAVRTRHCFRRFVKEIMTRFGFAKATDFDMYCIDTAGDRVDIDVEEDFDQLLDAFEATMANTPRESHETWTWSFLPTVAAADSISEPRSGRGKGTSQASLGALHAANSRATIGGSASSCFGSAGTPNHNIADAVVVPQTSTLQQHLLHLSPTQSLEFGTTNSMAGGIMDDDGKSSTSVLRLYVRYSNAYYREHGILEHPHSPNTVSPLYASPNPPNRIKGPNVASFFTNQLKQLSALPPASDDGRQAADLPGSFVLHATGVNLGQSVNNNNNNNNPNGSEDSATPFSHMLLHNMASSASGSNAVPMHQTTRGGIIGGGGTSFSVNGLATTTCGAGTNVRSSHFIGAGFDPTSPKDASLGLLAETQHSSFTATFMVDGSELVEWRRMSVLGKGSFGTVYEGITLDGKMVAVKVQELPLDDDAAEIKALQTEINLMRSLKHRNIVTYYGCQTRTTQTGGQQLEIFLELCHGGSLAMLRRKLIKTQHAFGISLVRSYTRQVLEGLAYLHAQKVMHRDIKSDNVLISATGEAKLADFGCSKRFGGGTTQASPSTLPPTTSVTHAAAAPAAMYQTMVGSPFFMAPEVMREDEGGYTSAADIWSVGCLVIELLGREPWEVAGTNVFQIMFRIARERGMPTGVPRNCPATLHSFFERCFERDPAKRATAAELLEHEWMTCPDKLLEEVPTEPEAKQANE